MKKRRLKKWVRYTIWTIFCLALLVGISECEDTKLYLLTHIPAIIVSGICGFILIKDLLKEN